MDGPPERVPGLGPQFSLVEDNGAALGALIREVTVTMPETDATSGTAVLFARGEVTRPVVIEVTGNITVGTHAGPVTEPFYPSVVMWLDPRHEPKRGGCRRESYGRSLGVGGTPSPRSFEPDRRTVRLSTESLGDDRDAQRTRDLADSLHARYGRPLEVNDISLPLGGKFDLSAAYDRGGEHAEHRDGRSADVRTHGPSPLTPTQRKFIQNAWEVLGGDVHDETVTQDGRSNTENPHYHLRF